MKKLLPTREYKYSKKYGIYEPSIPEKILQSIKQIKLNISFNFISRFINYILSDPIGLVVWLLIGGMIVGILYGFWWVLSLAGQLGPTLGDTFNLTLLNNYYVYYGRVGDLGKVPLLYLNLSGTSPSTSADIYAGYPVVKEFYLLKSSHPDFYNFIMFFPYPIRLVEASELRYLPSGAFLLIFDSTLPPGTTGNLSLNPNELHIVVITDTPPINEYTGTIPKPVYYLVNSKGNLDEVVSSASAPYTISERKYKIKNSITYGNFSSFTLTSDGKFVIFHPGGFDSYENITVMVNDVLKTIRSLYWIKNSNEVYLLKGIIRRVAQGINISSNHTLYPVPRASNLDHVSVIVEGDWVGANQKAIFSGQLAAENGPILLPYTSTQREETFRYTIYPYNNNITEDVLTFFISNGSKITYSQVLGRTLINTENRFGVPIKFPEGSYIATVKGQENQYAKYYFEVGNLNIEVVPIIKKGMFRFLFKSTSGSPLTLPRVEIFDYATKEKRTYVYVSEVIYTRKELEGKELPEGTYYFNVTVGQEIYTVSAYVPPKTALGKLFTPERLVLVVLAVLIYGGSMFLRKKEEIVYTIDIPEFPPQSTVRVELTEDEMKDLFNFINNYYKWKFMPLDKDEISFGLSQKKPELSNAVIDDYTFSIFLDELIHRGVIKENRGYYGLVDWEKQSGFTIDQLAMYRILRDKSIEMALPIEFNLDRISGYHAKLELGYDTAYIYLYHPKEFYYIVNNLPKFVGKGQLIVLFDNYEQKEQFKTQLYQGTLASDYFKFLINSGMVKLYTVDEFIDHIKKYFG